MPNEGIYLKEGQYAFLISMIEDQPGIENVSQAVQYCVNQRMQRAEANE